jgi:hypothetical protein
MANPPFDRGQEIAASNLVPGQTYYYYFGNPPAVETRSTGLQAYQTLRVSHVVTNNEIDYFVRGVDMSGKELIKPWSSNKDPRNHFFVIDPRPVQRAIGEIVATKLGISSAPGYGPANTIRKMVGVQPPPVTRGGRRRTYRRLRRQNKKRRATRRR